jgi:hypothetical protein
MLNGPLRKRLRLCSYCGAPLPEIRLGVKLTPTKSRLFDLIQRSGDEGILLADLVAILELNQACVKSHIAQINKAISGSGYRLYSRAKAVFLVKGPPPRKQWWRGRK